ncbi:MAG: SRPBCC domain-containing protein [Opitutales bacterium]|nr:SRPBCC domain-containing protein [Opitutales bacterium]
MKVPQVTIPHIEVEMTVDLPRAEVWRRWTTSEGVATFFAPESHIELRLGGAYELYFLPKDAPEGQRGSEGCRILAYAPERMLAFTWNAPPQLPNARQHHTWVVLALEDSDDGRTQVLLTHLGFAELAARHAEHATEFERTRDYFARVWPHVLGALKASSPAAAADRQQET